jgi:ubiquitin C-terminal hydrolase
MADNLKEKKSDKKILLHYDIKFIPKIYKLVNTGTLCYLNSLIQSLMSCSSFNEMMLSLKDKFVKEKNTLGIAYLDLYEKNKRTSEQTFERIDIENTSVLLREMIRLREIANNKNNLVMGRQEDVDEGLTLMLETLGDEISDMFHVRHKHYLKCLNCKSLHEAEVDPAEHAINLSEAKTVDGELLNSQKNIENYIKRIIDYPAGYICDKCNKQNTKDNKIIAGIYALRQLSSIIILRFTGKQATLANRSFNTSGTTAAYKTEDIYFPDKLEFESIDGILKYEVVAQLIQMGRLNGGHYISYCKRPCERLNDKKIEHLKERLSTSTADSDAKELKEALEKEEKMRSNRREIFIFDDTSIRGPCKEFPHSADTYLVFYQLVSITK